MTSMSNEKKSVDSIVLIRREAEQLQDMLENPWPRSPKFEDAVARHEQWMKENAEAIKSSNTYVEQHGLPLAKYKMPPEEAEHGDE